MQYSHQLVSQMQLRGDSINNHRSKCNQISIKPFETTFVNFRFYSRKMAITVGRMAIPIRSLFNNTKSQNWTAVYSQRSKPIHWISPAEADRVATNWSSNNNTVKTPVATMTTQHRLLQPRPPPIPTLSDGPYTPIIPQPNVLSITATL